ncbi:RICIN domain-containing protein, partial [Microbispora hainanensis]
GQNNQKWRLNSDGSITAVGANKCLDVSGAGTANGTKVQIWTCNGQNNQKWNRV